MADPRVDQHTRLFGVVGNPVRHSLGPLMHNAAFAARGINAVYLAFEVNDIAGCIRGVRALGIQGLSVTIPYKGEVIPHLDELEPLAARIGAVNTVVAAGGKLWGYNTDAIAALEALRRQTPVRGKRCAIIGAGGAARAIGFILVQHGAELIICNRGAERGEKLAAALGCDFAPLEQLPGIEVEILVQTTPVGMAPLKEVSPVPAQVLRPGMVVMDIIYNPLETTLLRWARERGCRVIPGLDMFVLQGGEQFRLWTGTEPPLELMAAVVRHALVAT